MPPLADTAGGWGRAMRIAPSEAFVITLDKAPFANGICRRLLLSG
jgi:hypothetical protein